MKMAIGKDQIREIFEQSQPKGSRILDVLVRTKDGETSFEELIIVADIPIAVPGQAGNESE